MFERGDKVYWESQSGGSWIRKEGEIAGIVPARILPVRVMPSIHQLWKVMFDGFFPRGHESYLVEVKTGKTAKAMRRLYWPRVSGLKKLNPQTTK